MVSDSVSRGWDSNHFSLRLGLDIETRKNPVSDSVSTLRLRKIQSRTRSQNWDSEDYSLGLRLELETERITFSVSKVHTWSRWSLSLQHDDPYVICFVLRGMLWTKDPDVYDQLQKYLVSDLILIKKLTKLQYPTLPQSWDTGTTSLRLSFNTKAKKLLVSDLVLIIRLEKFQLQTRSRNWHLKNSSLGLGLETETQEIWVSDLVSKLRLWKFQSRTWSQNWD